MQVEVEAANFRLFLAAYSAGGVGARTGEFWLFERPRSIAADLLDSALDATIARWRYVIREQKNQLQILNIRTQGKVHPTIHVFVKTVRI